MLLPSCSQRCSAMPEYPAERKIRQCIPQAQNRDWEQLSLAIAHWLLRLRKKAIINILSAGYGASARPSQKESERDCLPFHAQLQAPCNVRAKVYQYVFG